MFKILKIIVSLIILCSKIICCDDEHQDNCSQIQKIDKEIRNTHENLKNNDHEIYHLIPKEIYIEIVSWLNDQDFYNFRLMCKKAAIGFDYLCKNKCKIFSDERISWTYFSDIKHPYSNMISFYIRSAYENSKNPFFSKINYFEKMTKLCKAYKYQEGILIFEPLCHKNGDSSKDFKQRFINSFLHNIQTYVILTSYMIVIILHSSIKNNSQS